mmetsp:Transcript_29902/g.30222  ORF Transcript_29902/g.30222 Transcript_29902/m.30222 type:complete len:82 (-) Transcript_29902:200-445(-)
MIDTNHLLMEKNGTQKKRIFLEWKKSEMFLTMMMGSHFLFALKKLMHTWIVPDSCVSFVSSDGLNVGFLMTSILFLGLLRI